MNTVYEFFAGGGMARTGLGRGWRCLFANDFDPRKADAYRANFGYDELVVGDVRTVRPADLPGQADLAWASFPCQDLSLAGRGGGLQGERSGSFYPFWDVLAELGREGRVPRIVAIENVCGALTSHGGRDFEAICATYVEAGYRWGALVIDAALYLPQSRPRLFVVGVRADVAFPPGLTAPGPLDPFHPRQLTEATARLPERLRRASIWWRLPPPPPRRLSLADVLEDAPGDVRWNTPAQTARLIELMSPLHRARVEAASLSGRRVAGAVYRRTRRDADGARLQRAEVRFDGLAGCLRTPAGGSSRQTLLLVEDPLVRSRLLSAREAARLMGLPDSYRLPAGYTEAYHLAGDGVAVDVVRSLAADLFEPILAHGRLRAAA